LKAIPPRTSGSGTPLHAIPEITVASAPPAAMPAPSATPSDAMLAIAQEAAESPELLKDAPHHRPVRRLDEVRAAKHPIVKYGFEQQPQPDVPAQPVAGEAPKGA
jgi:hypothetical protein